MCLSQFFNLKFLRAGSSALAFCLLSPALFGQENGQQASSNLITNSPFLPPGYGAKAPEPEKQQITQPTTPLANEVEFRGIFQMGDAPPRFSIYDKRENKGMWLSLEETKDRFEVVNYDRDNSSITIKSGGQLQELTLSKISDKPIPIAGSAAGNRRPQANNGNGEEVTPQRKRIIPRRRIIRRRTSTNNNSTPPPPPAN